jgi:hypothetical protein
MDSTTSASGPKMGESHVSCHVLAHSYCPNFPAIQGQDVAHDRSRHMKPISILPCVAAIAFLAAFPSAWAEEKFDCANPLNAVIASVLKPIIEKAKLCKGLKQKVDAGLFKVKIKIDQTKSVKVEKINYCTSQAHRKIEATVAVECESDDDEEVHIKLAESFDVAVEINKTCAVTGFKVEPEGDIGKLIAKNTDFEGKVRKAVEREVAKACGGGF